MSDMLSTVEYLPVPHAGAAGFAMSDRASVQGVAWLEYHRHEAAGRLILSIFHLEDARTVTADVWRPTRVRRVRRVLRYGRPERAADWTRMWRYDDAMDIDHLRHDVAQAVTGWLGSLPVDPMRGW